VPFSSLPTWPKVPQHFQQKLLMERQINDDVKGEILTVGGCRLSARYKGFPVRLPIRLSYSFRIQTKKYRDVAVAMSRRALHLLLPCLRLSSHTGANKSAWEVMPTCEQPDDGNHLDIQRRPEKRHAKNQAAMFCHRHAHREFLPGVYFMPCGKGAGDKYCYDFLVTNISNATITFDVEACKLNAEWIIEFCPVGGTSVEADSWPGLLWCVVALLPFVDGKESGK
jgi:hypothetical protein